MAYSFEELLGGSRLRPIMKSVDLNIQRLSTDGTTYRDGEPDPALYKMLPLTSYLSLEQAFLKFQGDRPMMGSVVALDQEIPQERPRMQLTEENVGNFKIGQSRLFTEKDYQLLYKLRMMQATPGMAAAANELMMAFQAMPVTLSSGVLYKLFYMACRVLCLGQAAYTDPKTNYRVDLSYLDSVPSGHFAAAKTGTGRWSQPSTATGVQDLVDHLTVYYNTLRRYPTIGMNSLTFTQLRNQQATKEMVLRDLGVLSTLDATNQTALSMVAGATPEQIATAIGRRLTMQTGQPGQVSLLITDGVGYERNKDGSVTQFPYIPNDYYFFVNPGIIEQAILPNAANDFAGGMAVTTEILSKDPRRESVTASGVCVPLCFDPRYLGARNVNDTAIAV
ncbi:MAG TPA: hypothetical protein V6D19_06675 [Stenomitos sp.]